MPRLPDGRESKNCGCRDNQAGISVYQEKPGQPLESSLLNTEKYKPSLGHAKGGGRIVKTGAGIMYANLIRDGIPERGGREGE